MAYLSPYYQMKNFIQEIIPKGQTPDEQAEGTFVYQIDESENFEFCSALDYVPIQLASKTQL